MFLVGFKIVVFRKNSGMNQFLLQDLHKIEQVLGLVIAYIIYGIGRNGQTILT